MSSLDLRYKMLCKKEDSGRLPRGYQEVEYVQGNGGQYIDPGIYGSRSLNFEIDIQQNAVGSFIGFGSRYSWMSRGFRLSNGGSDGQPGNEIMIDYSNAYSLPKISYANDGQWHTWKLANGVFYVDNALLTNFSSVADFNTGLSVYLFATYQANPNSKYYMLGKYRISRCQFSLVGQTDLIRDFVPCYRKSDGEIGLYDLVNDVFYTNQGTGTFIKGNDIK